MEKKNLVEHFVAVKKTNGNLSYYYGVKAIKKKGFLTCGFSFLSLALQLREDRRKFLVVRGEVGALDCAHETEQFLVEPAEPDEHLVLMDGVAGAGPRI